MVSLLNYKNLFFVYLFGFFFAFHTALPTYINSSFLNVFISEKLLGIVYTIASILTILIFISAPYILRKFGNFKVSLFLIILEIFALVGLILGQSPVWLIFFFIISSVTVSFIYFVLDIFIESFSNNNATGKIRGAYLTLVNLAWIFSPFISGLILKNNNYWRIYFAALIFLIPILLIVILGLRNFKDSEYKAVSVFFTVKEIWANKNIKNILGANFLLQFFYSWMTIYTPLYLHKNMGYSWSDIGIIFSIMLIPFVLIQFPLGKVADEKIGEKEILITGFIFMALSSASLFFLPVGSSIWLWAVLLFITRIGAASVEVMCSTYFFRKVNDLNANVISFFSISRVLAYILGSFSITIALSFVGGEGGRLFLILAFIMLAGLGFSSGLQDTR